MIRYATIDDAEWIASLMEANPAICAPMAVKVIRDEIAHQMYIVNEDDDSGELCTFVRYVLTPNFVRIYLILTDEACRNKGHARLIYQYLRAKHQKPLRYIVEAGSENEQLWAKRSERVEDLTQHIGNITNSEGMSFNEYEVQEAPQ